MISDIREFCLLFYQTTAIPIHYYNTDKEPASKDVFTDENERQRFLQTLGKGDFSYPHILSDHSIFQGTNGVFSGFSQYTGENRLKSPDYFVSPSFSYFGFLNLKTMPGIIIIGPVFSTPATDLTVKNFMKEWAVSLKYKEDIIQILSSLPPVSFNRFLSTLAYLEFCLNDHKIDVMEHFGIANTDNTQELSQLHSDRVYENRENMNYHNTWDFERKMTRYVQDGEPEKLKELMKEAGDLTTGVIADNALRQRKNILITEITLITRSAILGGMDMEEAYQLSDLYIMDCERSQSVAYISNLEYTVLIDFAERVARRKIPEGMSQEIFECIQFIRKNVNAAIQTTDVANALGRSRSWLSTRFKKEMGFDLGEYIMRCKLEEAKSLLQFSDKTLSEISTYLCFSSQSYFQNVFRKKYGMTPKQYRDSTRKVQ